MDIQIDFPSWRVIIYTHSKNNAIKISITGGFRRLSLLGSTIVLGTVKIITTF